MKKLKNATLPHNYSKEGKKEWEENKKSMLKQQQEL